MKAECLAEVAAALGRAPTAREAAEIEGEIIGQWRELARTDPNYKAMTGQQRLQAAAALATEQALKRAEKQAERRASNLVAQARESARLRERGATFKARGAKNPHNRAVFERLGQLDWHITGILNEYMADLVPALQAVEGRFFELIEDPASVRAFAKAVLEGDTSEPVMAKAAKVWNETMDAMRERQNAAGADIGKLDYGYLPQPHDVGAIARAGADQYVTDMLGLVDRSRYVGLDGNVLDEAQLSEVLRAAYETLSTDGLNKLEPGAGARGRGSIASRKDDAHRVLHFKDADAYLSYLSKYGRGSMLEAMQGHVHQGAKQIGMMEQFGANPAATFRLLKDMAENLDGKRGAIDAFATLDGMWDALSGNGSQPVNERLARIGQATRNIITGTKLQGVLLSAVTDVPSQLLVAKSAGMTNMEALKSLVAGIGGRDVANDMAIAMDEMSSDLARWHGDNWRQGWTGKFASSTLKMTGINAWTNTHRRSFGLILSRALDRMRKKDWANLSEWDRRRFEAAGIDESTWKIWQKAEDDGTGRLSRHNIRAIKGLSDKEANAAVAKLLGYIDAEAKLAVLSPDLQTRAAMRENLKPGTIPGEIGRSLTMFKSFSVGIVSQHYRRMREMPSNSGRAAYSVALMTSLTLFGALAIQLKDLVNGKDPRDMTTGKFWLAAFMQGGGIGIVGDVFYTGMGGNSRGGQANWTAFAGPVFGTAFDAADVTLGNAFKAASGKETDFAADATRFVRGNAPFINLWYLRGAIDHMVLHDLQERISPGYLRRMQKRARKDWDQEFWWAPGEAVPSRAPDIEAAAGE